MIYSIGHSNHRLIHFLALLEQHGVRTLVDVRSVPFSRHAPFFNRRSLERSLPGASVEYLYLGQELGGRPDSPALYDEAGHVLYGRMAEAPAFQEAISWLIGTAEERPTVVMCAEEDPAKCHRWLLIGRVLNVRGVEMRHIRGDGRLDDSPPVQQALLPTGEWRSTRPIPPPHRPLRDSSLRSE